jgi:hypothetical protein
LPELIHDVLGNLHRVADRRGKTDRRDARRPDHEGPVDRWRDLHDQYREQIEVLGAEMREQHEAIGYENGLVAGRAEGAGHVGPFD